MQRASTLTEAVVVAPPAVWGARQTVDLLGIEAQGTVAQAGVVEQKVLSSTAETVGGVQHARGTLWRTGMALLLQQKTPEWSRWRRAAEGKGEDVEEKGRWRRLRRWRVEVGRRVG